ncbi:MAG: hypothetical protein ABIH46_11655 [Chloroflexota bacterium]
MKFFIDGDQLVITKDDFVDLQESQALFVPLSRVCDLLEVDRIFALFESGGLKASGEYDGYAFFDRPAKA